MAAQRTKIFVGHLPDGCKNEDLQTLFSKYGSVKECDVISKYGFVHMSTNEEADEAIKNLNNYSWMGSSISVEPSKSKLHPQPGAPGRAKNSIGGGSRNSGGGGPARNGFGSRNGSSGYRSGYTDGFPSMSFPGGDPYFDRPFGYGRDRLRPYPSPYERRTTAMPPMRDDFMRRPLPPPPPGTGELYGRPIPTLTSRDDLYERRNLTQIERSDYLYSRRSPPSSLSHSRPYWFGDSVTGDSGRTLATAARRPAFY